MKRDRAGVDTPRIELIAKGMSHDQTLRVSYLPRSSSSLVFGRGVTGLETLIELTCRNSSYSSFSSY